MGMKKIKIIFFSTLMILLLCCFFSKFRKTGTAKADETGGQVKIHLMVTSDIHGQVTAFDYEKKKEYATGGLSKSAAIIRQQREQYKNTMLFDDGDFLYDYTSDLIEAEKPEAVQPVLSAMSGLGYDFITVGNHDFDYGYDYLVKQLKQSGLYEKTLCANVNMVSDGSPLFQKEALVTREFEAEDGTAVLVKIGVFGITQPQISGKAYSHKDILSASGMLQTAKQEAASLKKQGADLVIALIHSGAGDEMEQTGDEDIGWLLSQCADVDVILAGHTHDRFPCPDKYNSPVYSLKGVDKETGLVNGKVLIQPSTRGQAVGYADLVLDGQKKLVSMRSDTIRVTNDVPEDKETAEAFSWAGKWLLDRKEGLYIPVENQEVLTNYFSLLEDSELMQLANDAKISYAASVIPEKYQKLPLVAVSKNFCYGKNGPEDYVELKNGITTSILSQLQPHNGYFRVYRVKASLLREWLEWSASAYAMTGDKGSYQSKHVGEYLASNPETSVLFNPSCYYNWKSYYVFDGISYEFDTSKPARYDFNGNKVNSEASRVGEILYNGKAMKENDTVLIACECANASVTWLPKDGDSILENGRISTYKILEDYVKQLGKLSKVTLSADHNWRIKPGKGTYIFTTGLSAGEYAKEKTWFKEQVPVTSDYAYLAASLPESGYGVHVNLSVKKIGKKYRVKVLPASAEAVKEIKYLKGETMDLQSAGWKNAKRVNKSSFMAEKGIYSVLIVNKGGKRAVKTVFIG